MNLLFTTPFTDEIGGGETSLIHLINECQNHGHQVHIVVPIKGKLGTILSQEGVPIFETSSPSQTLKSYIKTREITHIIHNNVRYGLQLFMKNPILIHGAHYLVHGPWDNIRGLKSLLLKLAGATLLCVSNDVYKKTHYSNKTIYPLGLPTQNRPMKSEKPNSNPNSTKTRPINIAVVGRFQAIKNQQFAIDVGTKLKECYNIQLRFIGGAAFTEESKHYYDQTRDYAKQMDPNKNWIHFEAIRENRDIFRGIDILFVPSQYESFGMVVIEALAAGQICIAPKIGGPEKHMAKLPRYLYTANNLDSAVQCLQQVIENFDSAIDTFWNQKESYLKKHHIERSYDCLVKSL